MSSFPPLFSHSSSEIPPTEKNNCLAHSFHHRSISLALSSFTGDELRSSFSQVREVQMVIVHTAHCQILSHIHSHTVHSYRLSFVSSHSKGLSLGSSVFWQAWLQFFFRSLSPIASWLLVFRLSLIHVSFTQPYRQSPEPVSGRVYGSNTFVTGHSWHSAIPPPPPPPPHTPSPHDKT